MDDDVLAELAEILDEVVGERIVVVDHQQHGESVAVEWKLAASATRDVTRVDSPRRA
jgi:hypothetical protein